MQTIIYSWVQGTSPWPENPQLEHSAAPRREENMEGSGCWYSAGGGRTKEMRSTPMPPPWFYTRTLQRPLQKESARVHSLAPGRPPG